MYELSLNSPPAEGWRDSAGVVSVVKNEPPRPSGTPPREGNLIPNAVLGTIRVRFRPDIGKPVEEISHPIRLSDIAPTFAKARPEFQIAAVASGFAERLRQSPYSPSQNYRELADLIRPSVQQLYIDPRFAELVRLLDMAGAVSGNQ